jgi:hypothetical protein
MEFFPFKKITHSSGLAIEQALSKFARDESGALRLIATSAGGTPNATLTITRTDNIPDTDIVAPFPAFFRATNLAGFAYTEPVGSDNVYDPTHHRINYIWDFGDPTYTPIVVPNVPTAWRDNNIARGRQVAHVFGTGGDRTVTCWAFDDQGNWGTATYRFGSGGNAPTIANPDTYFANAKTIVFSQDNIWTGEPSGATRCTTVAAVNSAMTTRFNAGDTIVRVLLRRGETYTNLATFLRPEGRGKHYGAYGPGTTRPKVINTTNNDGPFYLRDSTRHSVIAEMDWEGGYDATTETGTRAEPYGGLGSFGTHHLFYRTKVNGAKVINFPEQGGQQRVMADCEVTNWQNYGVYVRPDNQLNRFAMIGCDIHQHPDALNGVNVPGAANTLSILLGNLHGSIRMDGTIPNIYVAGNSFLSRNGWSQGAGTGSTFPPTAMQPAQRYAVTATTARCFGMWERNSFEGGDDMMRFVALGGGGTTSTLPRNCVVDGNLFVAAPTNDIFINSNCTGMTVRNNLFVVPAGNIGQATNTSPFARAIGFTASNDGLGAGPFSTNEVYNNTFVVLKNQSDFGGTAAPALVFTGPSLVTTATNNIVHAPSLSSPITTFAPIGNTALTGFTPRFKGTRWNFNALTAIVSAVREGGAGNVANGEWVSFAYPNYAGLNGTAGNALAPLTQAQATGVNSGGFHQVSVTGYINKAMAPSGVGGDGRVIFDFTAGAIRIQNNSGTTWTGTDRIWVLLDLRGFLMGFQANTSTTAALIPLAEPQAGSVALVADRSSGLWAHGGFFADYRQGVRTPPSGVAQTGKQHKLGAFA